MKIDLNCKVDSKLKARMTALAEEQDRSLAYMVNKALESFVANHTIQDNAPLGPVPGIYDPQDPGNPLHDNNAVPEPRTPRNIESPADVLAREIADAKRMRDTAQTRLKELPPADRRAEHDKWDGVVRRLEAERLNHDIDDMYENGSKGE